MEIISLTFKFHLLFSVLFSMCVQHFLRREAEVIFFSTYFNWSTSAGSEDHVVKSSDEGSDYCPFDNRWSASPFPRSLTIDN